MDKPTPNFPWLSEEEYSKAKGQLRLQIGGALHPLRMYGQDVYVDTAVDIILDMAEDFGLRVRGYPRPISYELTAKKRLLKN